MVRNDTHLMQLWRREHQCMMHTTLSDPPRFKLSHWSRDRAERIQTMACGSGVEAHHQMAELLNLPKHDSPEFQARVDGEVAAYLSRKIF